MMFEPITLTVHELADRWKMTPHQIIEHAEACGVPLHFRFEGLVFDISDEWHRHGGDVDEAKECDRLDKTIPRMEAHLLRRANGLTGQYDHLDEHEAKKMRASIDEGKKRRRLLADLLEQREHGRQRMFIRSWVRATPKTLSDILIHGATPIPRWAFHSQSPIKIVLESRRGPDGAVAEWDGRRMALEAAPGCDYPPLTLDSLGYYAILRNWAMLATLNRQIRVFESLSTRQKRQHASRPFQSQLIDFDLLFRSVQQTTMFLNE